MRILSGLLLIVLGLAVWQGGCTKCETMDDAAAIRGIIENGAKLAQERDIKGLLDLATKDFQAYPGSRGRREVKAILFATFQQYGKFLVKFHRPLVTVDSESGTAKAQTSFLIVRQGQKLPDLSDLYEDPEGWIERAGELADPYHLELSFIKDEDVWRVRRANILGLGRVQTF